MASTAYGGSSELTDIMTRRSPNFRKHTFDVTGRNDISASIQRTLDSLAASPETLMRTTVLFVEIPTNPDMKVPDITDVAHMCMNYRTATGRNILILLDTTFAPGSQSLLKLRSG